VLVAALPARGLDMPDLRTLFPNEAPVHVTPPGGLTRIVLPPAVLAECRPDLSDLRIMDAQGREVAFRVDSGAGSRTEIEVTESARGELLGVRRDETRRENGPPLHRETYEVSVPAKVVAGGAWDLVLETSRVPFVRRVDVAATQADGTSVPLVENSSVFRLAAPERARTRVALPSFTADKLTVTLVGEDGFYLEPAFRFETARVIEPQERIVVPLEEISRTRARGRTVVELARPGGIVPDGLRLETTTGAFNRNVEVWDEQRTGSGRLGHATLFRAEAAATVEEREVVLQPAHGERLRVEVEDGDSPTLDALRFSAIVRQPSLVFSIASSSDETPAAWLRFGGGRAYAPRYDLAGLTLPATGTRATAAERLHDLAAIPLARLGESRPNAHFDGAPALAFAMRAGTVIDTRSFRYRRKLRVNPSAEGLSRLRLASVDIASAMPNLSDLRIVDAEGQQWPYLLVSGVTTDWQDIAVGPPARKDGASTYRLALPVAPLEIDQLTLETDTPFFHREGVLRARTGDGEPYRLSNVTLARRNDRPLPLAISFQRTRVYALELELRDGDDKPLTFRCARLRVPVTELYLAAPAGEYSLLFGDPEARPPSYELARARDVVLAVASAPVILGEAGRNPDYSVSVRLSERTESALPKVVLWSVIGLAVVGLTVLTLRLARAEGGGAS
jgi:hypothetical protein